MIGSTTIDEYSGKMSNPYNSYKKRVKKNMIEDAIVNYDNLKVTLIKPLEISLIKNK